MIDEQKPTNPLSGTGTIIFEQTELDLDDDETEETTADYRFEQATGIKPNKLR